MVSTTFPNHITDSKTNHITSNTGIHKMRHHSRETLKNKTGCLYTKKKRLNHSLMLSTNTRQGGLQLANLTKNHVFPNRLGVLFERFPTGKQDLKHRQKSAGEGSVVSVAVIKRRKAPCCFIHFE